MTTCGFPQFNIQFKIRDMNVLKDMVILILNVNMIEDNLIVYVTKNNLYNNTI